MYFYERDLNEIVEGPAAGRVFTFAHDELSFTEAASCLRDFVARQIELNDLVLNDIATVLRPSEPGGAHQWWIRSAVDNRGGRARSLGDSRRPQRVIDPSA